MSVLYDDVQLDHALNSQEYNKFWNLCGNYQDIYMTEYHHWINRLTIYSNTAVYGEKWV